jgi:hypothetical protein
LGDGEQGRFCVWQTEPSGKEQGRENVMEPDGTDEA